MRLTPTEMDRLTIFTAAELARRRCGKGWKLSHPEALAIICDEMHEAARGGGTYEAVIKGGFVAWGALGEGNASIPQAQPTLYAAHWGGSGRAAASVSANFVSAAAVAGDFRRRVRSRRVLLAVAGTRRISKRHMLYNGANPRVEIDPRTVEIRIDGQPLPPLPDDDFPLNRRYFLM